MTKGQDDSRRYLDGIIIEKLDNIEKQNVEIKKEFSEFKADAYNKIGKNSTDIARQKGWMTGKAVAGGTVGGIIKSFLHR